MKQGERNVFGIGDERSIVGQKKVHTHHTDDEVFPFPSRLVVKKISTLQAGRQLHAAARAGRSHICLFPSCSPLLVQQARALAPPVLHGS
jgi:hypothetical protein